MRTQRAKFARERATFESKRSEWVDAGYEGRWMAVKGSLAIGPYDRFGLAWDAAVRRFRGTNVLVDRVLVERPRESVVFGVRSERRRPA
jgi:hypothetical protein